jgi:hypothetical protein
MARNRKCLLCRDRIEKGAETVYCEVTRDPYMTVYGYCHKSCAGPVKTGVSILTVTNNNIE